MRSFSLQRPVYIIDMKMDGLTENDLLARAQADLEAFAELVERYRGSIQRQCRSRVHDWQHAEDLAQETFVRAYLNLSQLSSPELFPNWLRKIASNVCNEFLRSSARREVATDLLADHPSAQRDPAAVANLDLLPHTTRRCVELFYEEGLSYSEIAEALNTTTASVKGRLRRARAVLRKEWTEMAPRKRSVFTQRVLDTLEQLTREDADERKRAASRLHHGLAQDKVEELLSGLAGPDHLERSYWIRGSRKHISPRVRDALVEILLHDEWEENRLKAANALVAQRDRAVIPYLGQAMADPWNPRDVVAAARSAAKQLERMTPPEATEPATLEFRQDLDRAAGEPESRAELLARLTKALGDPDSGVRSQSIKALQALGDRRAVPAIAKLLEDPVAGVRAAAALALGEIGGRRAMEALGAIFDDSHSYTRPAVAYQSLAKIGDRTVLAEILRHLSPGNVFTGLDFAVRVGSPADIPMIRQALKDYVEGDCPPPWKRTFRMLTEGLVGQELLDDMIKWPVCVEFTVRLALIGDDTARSALKELLLRHGVQKAAEALAGCGEFGIEALREALKHQSTGVRLAACSGLAAGQVHSGSLRQYFVLTNPESVRALLPELEELAEHDPAGSIRLRAKVAVRNLEKMNRAEDGG